MSSSETLAVIFVILQLDSSAQAIRGKGVKGVISRVRGSLASNQQKFAAMQKIVIQGMP